MPSDVSAPPCLAKLFLFRTEFSDFVSFLLGAATNDFLFLAIVPLPVSVVDGTVVLVPDCYLWVSPVVYDLLLSSLC